MYLFSKVLWRNKTCIVTNASIGRGIKIQISPTGNGDSPAKYYTVYPDEVTLITDNVHKPI